MFKLEDLIGQGLYGETIGSNQAIDFSGSPSVLLPARTISHIGSATLVVAASDSLNTQGADYTCTGTNDQTTINTAIGALPTGGGRVILLEGTYNLGGSINIAGNNITLEGQGKGTYIKLANSINTALVTVGDNTTQFYRGVIKGIYFDGNQANQITTSVPDIDNYSSSFPMAELLITECYFVNSFQNAIGTQVFASGVGILGTTITNCVFENWKGQTGGSNACLLLSDYPNGSIVQNCLFKGNITTGTVLYDGNINSTVVGCSIVLPSGYNDTAIQSINILEASVINITTPGASCIAVNFPISVLGNKINFLGTPNAASTGITLSAGATLTGNYLSNCGIGVSITSGASGIAINGNYFTGIKVNAVLITTANHNTISGNVFQNCSQGTANTDAVVLATGISTYNIVTGNNFFSSAINKPKYNFRENSASDGPNIITSNVSLNAATTQISIQNANTDMSHNITA